MDEVNTVGVRELRNQVAAVIRRAANGDRMVITVDGKPVAQLTPLVPVAPVSLEDLVAAGLVDQPGRSTKPEPPEPAVLPVDARAEWALQEVRG